MTNDFISIGPGPLDRDEAITAIFYAYYPRLVQAALVVTDDRDLSEQLAQEALLRLWRRWRRIRDPQAAPAYLYRIVLNLSRDAIRRRVRERRALSYPPGHNPDADLAGDVDLHRAVAALPHRQKACIVLRYLAGLTEAETAQVLGVSAGTVKSQTHKAMRRLRAQLADISPDDDEQHAQGTRP